MNLSRSRVAFAVAVALGTAAGSAHALRLGEARLLSRYAEPLVVEIDAQHDASEADGAQFDARVAGASAYAELGLEPVPALVGARARYASRRDRGVIRIEGAMPLHDLWVPLVVEVDTPAGRLRRQYDLIVEMLPAGPAPQPRVAERAPDRPQAAAPPASSAQKPAAAGAVSSPTPPAAAAASMAAGAPAGLPPRARPQATATRVAAARPAVPRAGAPVPTPAAVPAEAAREQHRVRPGESLARIARRLTGSDPEAGGALMRRILADNPHAFRDGNPNLLYAGAMLTLPAGAALPAPEAVPGDLARAAPAPARPAPGAPGGADPVDQAIVEARERIRALNERAVALESEIGDLEKRKNVLQATSAASEGARAPRAAAAGASAQPGVTPASRTGEGGFDFVIAGVMLAIGMIGFLIGRRSRRAPALVAEPALQSVFSEPTVKPARNKRGEALDFTRKG